jgi:2-iminobutanoate/2-iminopropanoate deaminase
MTTVGPYAPAVRAGDWLVTSGQLGILAGAGGPELAGDDISAQAAQALENVAELLAGRGLGWRNVVKVNVYLTDIGDAAEFNSVYADALGDHRPARSMVAVAALPLGARVEIDAWAYSS